MNLYTRKLSGFILQKDVFITNILYENNLIPKTNLKQILPFRPKTGRIPQDPRECLQISKQIIPITNITKNEGFYFFKKRLKNNILKNKKLKFPLPKMKLRPISSNDFYKNLTGRNIRTRNLDDDLNITSKHGKKFYYSFKNKFNKENREKYKEKYVKVGIENILNNKRNYFDEYFDYGFHINKDNDNDLFKNNRIKSATKLKVNIPKKLFQKDNTFKTQIDFNLLYSNNNFINGANTDKFQSRPNNYILLS